MRKNRLLVAGAAVVLCLGCESPVDLDTPLDGPPVTPSYSFLSGDGPILLGVTNQGNLVRINVGAGTATLIGDAGQHPVEGHDLGWTGVTYGPGGHLYATSRTFGDPRSEGCGTWNSAFNPSTACSHLYTIDPQTGAMLADLGGFGVTSVSDISWETGAAWMGSLRHVLDGAGNTIGAGFVRSTPDASPPTAFTPVTYGDVGPVNLVGNPVPGAGGIAYHPVTGEWWGVDFYPLPMIFRIDPATGKAIYDSGVYLTLDGAFPGFGFSGMTISAEGEAFVTANFSFEIYAVDLATGVLTAAPVSLGPGIQGQLTSFTEAIPAAFTFASVNVTLAEVTFGPAQGDAFTLGGSLTLDPASDGLDPANEDVTIRVGSFLQNIPAGAFVRDAGQSLYRYTGTAPGLTLVELRDDLTFTVVGDGLSLPPADQVPQAVGLVVGNDEGEVTVLFTLVGPPPPRPTALVLASTDRGEILSLDLGAGTGTVVGRVLQYQGRLIGWTGLAFAPTGDLFVSTIIQSGLPTDQCQGEVIYFGTQCSHLFIVEADSGYVYRDLGSTNIGALSDLTFRSGTLLATHFMNETNGEDGGLATLDQATGASTHVGRQGTWEGSLVTNGGIAYDPATGTLWAVEDEYGAGRLLELDASSGAVLGSVALTEGGSPIGFGFEGLEALPGGFLLGVRSEGSRQIYQIDSSTGAVTLVPMNLPSAEGAITGIVLAEGINRTPKANAGPDQTVPRTSPTGADVALDGSASFDPDGTLVSYEWSEAGQPLAGGATPVVPLGLGTHVLTLSVTDAAGAVRTSQVTITVVNAAPIADPGPDRTVPATDPVHLDGSGSSDPDGTIDSYEWLIGGAVVATGVTADVALAAGVHDVTLRVTDNDGAVAEATARITVADRVEVVLQAEGDAFLHPGKDKDTNEGANAYLSLDDGRRVVLAFDLGGIDPATVTSARLVLAPDPGYEARDWGGSGGDVGAYRLLRSFPEGNGAHLYLGKKSEQDGSGSGVTWNCREDTRIQNDKRNCAKPERWDGGTFQEDPTATFVQNDGAYDELVFDVTADVVEGSTLWLVKALEEWLDDGASGKSAKSGKSGKKSDKSAKSAKGKGGMLRLFSREGAPDPSFAPRLIVEYTAGGSIL